MPNALCFSSDFSHVVTLVEENRKKLRGTFRFSIFHFSIMFISSKQENPNKITLQKLHEEIQVSIMGGGDTGFDVC